MQRRAIVGVLFIVAMGVGMSGCMQPTEYELEQWVHYSHVQVDPKPPVHKRAEDGTDVDVGASMAERAVVSGPGHVDPRAIDAAFESRSDEVVDCFRRAVLAERATSGTLRLRFQVMPSGYARRVRVVENSSGKPVGDCVREAVGRWNFPAPNSRPATIEKQIRMSTEGR